MTATSMPARPSVWSEMFTWEGRANRGRYWLTAFLWVLVLLPIWLIAVFSLGVEFFARMTMTGLLMFYAIGFIVGLPVLFVSIRRLHDRDKSGHWLWLFWGVTSVLSGISQYMQTLRGTNDTSAFVFAILSFIISIWAFVELGCLRGTTGPNRFGPDPLHSV